jgi:hypothetical protein
LLSILAVAPDILPMQAQVLAITLDILQILAEVLAIMLNVVEVLLELLGMVGERMSCARGREGKDENSHRGR